ncbi:hypothetical protein [Haladaptatus sp. ZSTT2]|uniref:hypothetical protein n=1 Tax=Haladaptatus sp. ZSTT2 TaxID=3120515 RepID=UPI00300ED8C0
MQRSAGRAVRGVVCYDEHSYHVVTLRKDVAQKHDEAYFARLTNRFRRVAPTNADETTFELGELASSLHVFEDALIMHLPCGEHEGILISLEQTVGRQLVGFLGDCRTVLEAGTQGHPAESHF